MSNTDTAATSSALEVTPDALETLNGLAIATTDERDIVLTFEEAIAAAGLTEEQMVFVASNYRVLTGDDKSELIAKPFFIRLARFAIDPETDRPYVVLYVVTKDNEMLILTDGSTGIYKQISKRVAERIEDKHPTPVENWMVVNGLRVSEYGIDADGNPVAAGVKPAGKARTFYIS